MKTSIKTQSRSKTSLVAAALIVLACAASSGRVVAQPAQFTTKTVAFGDLNLDSDQGAKILYARLRHAAQDVCVPLEDSRELSRKANWQTCVDSALASAIRQVNKPRVNALYKQNVTSRSNAG
jgi:UrcA family protein